MTVGLRKIKGQAKGRDEIAAKLICVKSQGEEKMCNRLGHDKKREADRCTPYHGDYGSCTAVALVQMKRVHW